MRVVFVRGILGVIDGFLLMVPIGASASKKAICWSVGVALSVRSDDAPLLLDDSFRSAAECSTRPEEELPRSLAVMVRPESESALPRRSDDGSSCDGLVRSGDPLSGLTAASVLAIEQMEKLRA